MEGFLLCGELVQNSRLTNILLRCFSRSLLLHLEINVVHVDAGVNLLVLSFLVFNKNVGYDEPDIQKES
jgi:hypothetical protein